MYFVIFFAVGVVFFLYSPYKSAKYRPVRLDAVAEFARKLCRLMLRASLRDINYHLWPRRNIVHSAW